MWYRFVIPVLERQSGRSYKTVFKVRYGAEEMVQHEDLNSILRIPIGDKKPVMEACTCHPSAGKAERGGSHHLLAGLPILFGKLQAPEKFCLKASKQANKQNPPKLTR